MIPPTRLHADIGQNRNSTNARIFLKFEALVALSLFAIGCGTTPTTAQSGWNSNKTPALCDLPIAFRLDSPIDFMDFSPDGMYLIGKSGGQVFAWRTHAESNVVTDDLSAGSTGASRADPYRKMRLHTYFSPQKNHVLIPTSDHSLLAFNLGRFQSGMSILECVEFSAPLLFSSDGKSFLTVSPTWSLGSYHVESGLRRDQPEFSFVAPGTDGNMQLIQRKNSLEVLRGEGELIRKTVVAGQFVDISRNGLFLATSQGPAGFFRTGNETRILHAWKAGVRIGEVWNVHTSEKLTAVHDCVLLWFVGDENLAFIRKANTDPANPRIIVGLQPLLRAGPAASIEIPESELLISSGGSCVALVDEDGTAKLLSLSGANNSITQAGIFEELSINGTAQFSQSGRIFGSLRRVSKSNRPVSQTVLIDATKGKIVDYCEIKFVGDAEATCIAVSPDDLSIAVGGSDGTVRIRKLERYGDASKAPG